MDKENVIYTYNGILFRLKKVGNPAIYDEPWGHYAKWKKAVPEGYILYDSTYMRYLL